MFKVHTVDTLRADIAQMCRKLPVYVQRKPPTASGLMALLEQLVSVSYNADNSREEVRADEHFNAAFNAHWVELDDYRWSGGTKYRRHRITMLGRAALAVLRHDLRVPYDEHSAEWLDAERALDARERDARQRETVRLRTMQDAIADADHNAAWGDSVYAGAM